MSFFLVTKFGPLFSGKRAVLNQTRTLIEDFTKDGQIELQTVSEVDFMKQLSDDAKDKSWTSRNVIREANKAVIIRITQKFAKTNFIDKYICVGLSGIIVMIGTVNEITKYVFSIPDLKYFSMTERIYFGHESERAIYLFPIPSIEKHAIGGMFTKLNYFFSDVSSTSKIISRCRYDVTSSNYYDMVSKCITSNQELIQSLDQFIGNTEDKSEQYSRVNLFHNYKSVLKLILNELIKYQVSTDKPSMMGDLEFVECVARIGFETSLKEIPI